MSLGDHHCRSQSERSTRNLADDSKRISACGRSTWASTNRARPDEVYADAGYDTETTRDSLRSLGMTQFIRKRTAPHGSHLGRVRWVVERSIAWLKGLRRLRLR
ncbi:transposase [Rosistilla oblonga]|uniref:transposase n=1 Tax=Rosistilla oblonga TaxID=2527990 RepID=UPI003A9741E0